MVRMNEELVDCMLSGCCEDCDMDPVECYDWGTCFYKQKEELNEKLNVEMLSLSCENCDFDPSECYDWGKCFKKQKEELKEGK